MTENAIRLMSGMAVGAGIMYLLDPSHGGRRRALARDRVVWGLRKTRDAADATSRDLGNRLSGLAARSRRVLSPEEIPDNAVLEARVRAALGRHSTHPGSIEVGADHGRVTLRGPILANEIGDLVSAVWNVPGVAEVDDQLTVYDSAEHVPGLQGEGRIPSRPFWRTPSAKLALGVSAAALAVAVAARRAA